MCANRLIEPGDSRAEEQPVNVTSSLERNYFRSASIVAGVGVLATGHFLGAIGDEVVEPPADGTTAPADPASFTAALAAASAA
jgi:hypothetical protein